MRIINSLCLTIAAITTASSVMAADLPSKKPPPPALLSVPSTWTGFYAGLNAGYGFGGSDRVGIRHNGALLGNIGTSEQSGFVGGVQAGYSYQFSNNVVAGIETDFQGATLTDSRHGVIDRLNASAKPKTPWYGTVRPRLGYAFGNTLIFGTGGLAYGEENYNLDWGRLSLNNDKTRIGWTVGGGIEQALTEHWTMKLEYDFVYLGSYQVSAYNGRLATKPTADFNSVRLGVNYKF
jgi:outer membrane immunogenic protein